MFHYNPDNKVLQTLSLYFDLTLLAALWVVSSVPVVTVGVSTTALYRVLLKMASGDGVTSVVRAFFGCWRGEWRRGSLVWILLLGFLALVSGDLYVCVAYRPRGAVGLALWAGTFLAAALALCLLVYVFPINARFDCTARQVFSNAVRFTAGNPGRTLTLVGLLLLRGASIFFLLLLAVFALGPLLYLSAKRLSAVFEPVLRRYAPEPEEEEGS